jgi:hypothetical protein
LQQIAQLIAGKTPPQRDHTVSFRGRMQPHDARKDRETESRKTAPHQVGDNHAHSRHPGKLADEIRYRRAIQMMQHQAGHRYVHCGIPEW